MQYNAPNRTYVFQIFFRGGTPGPPFGTVTPNRVTLPYKILAARLGGSGSTAQGIGGCGWPTAAVGRLQPWTATMTGTMTIIKLTLTQTEATVGYDFHSIWNSFLPSRPTDRPTERPTDKQTDRHTD